MAIAGIYSVRYDGQDVYFVSGSYDTWPSTRQTVQQWESAKLERVL